MPAPSRKKSPQTTVPPSAPSAPSAHPFSRQQLEQAPERAFRFLFTVGRYPVIMQHLEDVGYTAEDQEQGWALLHQISAYKQAKATPSSNAHKEAVAGLDGWDEPNFRRASAALQFRYPEQHSFLFHDLKAEQGEKAIQSVQTFLDRVEALEKGSRSERKASAKQDKEAAQLLYKRKILSDAILEQLRAWLQIAKSTPDTAPLVDAQTLQAQQDEWLVQIAQWFTEWSQIARSAKLRRSHLISLGLAKRRTNSPPVEPNEDDEDDDNDLPTPAPTPQPT